MNDTIILGFTRGVAPSKWEKRWKQAMPTVTLELVPVATPFGRPQNGDFDAMIERVAPGAQPESSDPDDASRTHHALKLYEESVALVVPIDHELAELTEIRVSDIGLIRLLDHPDHSPEWPAPEPWAEQEWMPKNIAAALALVATGLGGILAPLPLARHIGDKRQHALLRVVSDDESTDQPLPGTTVWASWRLERDAADVQQLAGILRGRTARSSRGGSAAEAIEHAKTAPKARTQQQPAKKKPKLKPNSRGAQLAAAREKAERAKAAKRNAKKKR